MNAFEVYVNKVKVCTAGIGELDGIVSSLICRANPDGGPGENQFCFSVGGVDGGKPYRWVYSTLNVGDRIEIRIVDAKKTDPPKEYSCPGVS